MPFFRSRPRRALRTHSGFIRPCFPTLARRPPEGTEWIHELKHDGYRILALRNGGSVNLFSRGVIDWAKDFRPVADALLSLPASSLTLDGELVAHNRRGLPDFHALRRKNAHICYYAFDLLELDGENLRPLPLILRRARLQRLLQTAPPALRVSEYLEGDGAVIFRHACALGLEGIVSKRKQGRYASGRSRSWLKIKNPQYRRDVATLAFDPADPGS
jgi:bifunctional non-homologous end joining protein LigD